VGGGAIAARAEHSLSLPSAEFRARCPCIVAAARREHFGLAMAWHWLYLSWHILDCPQCGRMMVQREREIL
jgi:hypothetical protein